MERAENPKVGGALRLLREKGHLTQRDVAEAMGVTRQTVYLWEKDYLTPRLCYLIKLADFYKTTIPQMILLAGEKRTTNVKQ